MKRAEYMTRWGEAYRNEGMEAALKVRQQYYGQYVTPAIRRYLEPLRPKILSSTDEHFNEIPLREWDYLPHPPEVVEMLTKNDPGGISAADWVCIYKEAARQLREEDDEAN